MKHSAALGGLILAVALLSGMAERWLFTLAAPQYGYYPDHMMNIGFGLTAQRDGLFKAYLTSSSDIPIQIGQTKYGQSVWQSRIGVNYPPLGLTLFWLQSRLLPNHSATYSPAILLEVMLRGVPLTDNQRAFIFAIVRARGGPANVLQDDVGAAVASLTPQQTLQWENARRFLGMQCNTVESRATMSITSILADAAMATAVFFIALALFGSRAALVAGIVCWIFPPLAMDTSFWGQQDSWIGASAAWMVYMLIRGQWVGAGFCLAAAILLKPQGLLLGPIVVAAAVLIRGDAPALAFRTIILRLCKSLGTAVIGIVVLTLPWTITELAASKTGVPDHTSGWIRRAYLSAFDMYPATQLKAFNVWYVDTLMRDSEPNRAALDSSARVLGLSKDMWGRLFISGALVCLFWLCWWRYRHWPELAVAVFSGLWLWSTFIWPTRVHERYIVLGMPFIILLAAGLWRYWPGLLGLMIVGTAELCWNTWLDIPGRPAAGEFDTRIVEQRYQEMTSNGNTLPPEYQQFGSTYNDVVRYFYNEYRKDRAKVVGWEWSLTVISLLTYGAAIFAASMPPRRRPAFLTGRGLS